MYQLLFVSNIALFSLFVICLFFFFFKQKTAYEMRISDWSSDVCSSDLLRPPIGRGLPRKLCHRCKLLRLAPFISAAGPGSPTGRRGEIGRASCRERVSQYV